MKKLLSLVLAMMLLCTAIPALAVQQYTGHLTQDATFETLAEARASAPAVIAAANGAAVEAYAANTALATYPDGIAFVYRSANMFAGSRQACKMNTAFIVLAEEHFETKEEAKAYLDNLGVIELADALTGSVVLVTPANGTAFATADVNYYKNLQSAMTAQKTSGTVDGARVTFADGEYYGAYGYLYLIAIGGAATFANNNIATNKDLVTRIAGMLLVNGNMLAHNHVAAPVAAYLVGCSDKVVAEYKTVNAVNAEEITANAVIAFNQSEPSWKVATRRYEGMSVEAAVKDAFETIFTKVMRISAQSGVYTLIERDAIVDGKTAAGVYVTLTLDDRFIDIKTVTGSYLDSWYEILPQEVVDGSAADGSIPLILALNGMGDDPLMFADGQGFVRLAGEERVAVVAPAHEDVFWATTAAGSVEGIEQTVMPMLVEYMLETYPALDATRVYASGYSMGGWATQKSLHGKPELFAAVAPMSGVCYTPTEEEAAQFETLDIPTLITTSTTDMGMLFSSVTGGIESNHQRELNLYLGYNEMDQIETFDFVTYPMTGFAFDTAITVTLEGGFVNHRWFLEKDGIPMVGLGITEGPTHSLYPVYAQIMYEFCSHYSRDPETKAVVYHP